MDAIPPFRHRRRFPVVPWDVGGLDVNRVRLRALPVRISLEQSTRPDYCCYSLLHVPSHHHHQMRCHLCDRCGQLRGSSVRPSGRPNAQWDGHFSRVAQWNLDKAFTARIHRCRCRCRCASTSQRPDEAEAVAVVNHDGIMDVRRCDLNRRNVTWKRSHPYCHNPDGLFITSLAGGRMDAKSRIRLCDLANVHYRCCSCSSPLFSPRVPVKHEYC